MNLKDLVPPLELCKLIPKGHFEDSAFVWVRINWATIEWRVLKALKKNRISKMHKGYEYYPAPTLQEILEELPWDFEFSHCYNGVPTEKYITILNPELGEVGNNGVESAMKTWLVYKGIKNA